MDRHLIDEIVFDLSFDAQASFEHQDDIRAFVCDRLLPVIDEVCSAHADPASVLRLGALEIDLGDVPADNFELEMARRLRSKLDDILAGIRRSPATSAVRAERVSRRRAEFEQLAYFLLHGSLPWQSDADDARVHERLMESVLMDGAELAALLKRSPRAHRERMVERLARQFGPRHLETVLRQLEPAQADGLLATMNDLQAAMAEAGISFDAGMLWQQAMLGASEISGKSFDAALLLDLALRQIAAAHGEVPAAIGKTLLGAARRLYKDRKTGARLAELLDALQAQGAPDEDETTPRIGKADDTASEERGSEAAQLHQLRHRLAQAMLRGDPAMIADDWRRIVSEQPAMLAEALRRYASREDALARIAANFTASMIADLLHAASPALAALAFPLEQGAAVFWKAAGEFGADSTDAVRRRWRAQLLAQAVTSDAGMSSLRAHVQEAARSMAGNDRARAASILHAWRDAATGVRGAEALDEALAQLPTAPMTKRTAQKSERVGTRAADDTHVDRGDRDEDAALQEQDVPGTLSPAHAADPDAARRSESVLEGQDLFELLWKAAQGADGAPQDGAPLVTAIDVLARRHPLQLRRLFRQWRQLPSSSARLPAAVFQRLAQALIEERGESDSAEGGSDAVMRRAFVESISARAAEAEDMEAYFRAVFDNLLHKRPLDLDALVHGGAAVQPPADVDEGETHMPVAVADGRLLRDLIDGSDEAKSREAARLLVERKSAALKSWLEQSSVSPQRTAKLARLLPESMLARVLAWLHGAEHGRVEESAQEVADAFAHIAPGTSDAQTAVWKWEYVLEHRFGRREAFESQRFARGLAAHLARRGAGGESGLEQAVIARVAAIRSMAQAGGASGAEAFRQADVVSHGDVAQGSPSESDARKDSDGQGDATQPSSRTPADAAEERAAMRARMLNVLPAGPARTSALTDTDEARSIRLLEGHDLYERWLQRLHDGVDGNVASVIDMLATRHPMQFRRVLRGLHGIGAWESLPLSEDEWRALAHAGAAALPSVTERAEWKALLSAEPEQGEASAYWRTLLGKMLAGVPAAQARDEQTAEASAEMIRQDAAQSANHFPNASSNEQEKAQEPRLAVDTAKAPTEETRIEDTAQSDDATVIAAYVRSDYLQKGSRLRFVQAVERLLANDAVPLTAVVEDKPEHIARIVDALPERLLTRWLRAMHPGAHAAMHAIADDITEAFTALDESAAAAGTSPPASPAGIERNVVGARMDRIAAAAWRHVIAEAINEKSFVPESFAVGLADRLAQEVAAPTDLRQAVDVVARKVARSVEASLRAISQDRSVPRETDGAEIAEQTSSPSAARHAVDAGVQDSIARSEDIVRAYDAVDLLLAALTPLAEAPATHAAETDLAAAVETLRSHLPLLRRFFRKLRGMSVKAPAVASVWQSLAQVYLKRLQPESGPAMLDAIDAHAQEAASQRVYWREVLLCLLENRALDLEALGQLDDLPETLQPVDGEAVAGAARALEEAKVAADAAAAMVPDATSDAEPMSDEAKLRAFLDGDATADSLMLSTQSSLREAVGRLVEFKSPALKAWFEQSPQTARKAVKLAHLLPESMLTRILLWLRSGEHAQVQESADCVADALLELAEDIGEKEAGVLKWEYILTERFEKRSAFEPGAFMRDLADRLIERLPIAGATNADVLRSDVKTRAAAAYRKLDAAHAAAVRDTATAKPGVPGEALAYRTAAEEAPLETIYIANAGQVLAAPYLPRLFQMLNLVDKGRFVDRAAAERAAHLLQFMVDERTESPEHQLALNKILCGITSGVPIVRGIEITDGEKNTVEGLLKGMIENWKAIGNTSIAGLRESFLRREGWLRLKEDAWHLEVLPGTFDMLLDRLPWGFSIIRHPWMERAVHVSWR